MQQQVETNRMARAVARIQGKLDRLDSDKLAELDKDNDITFEEHFYYQTVQSQAHAAMRITPDEAQVIYDALGEVRSFSNGGWTLGTDLATKLAVTLCVGELA